MEDKEIVIKIKVNCEKDEFGNIIDLNGFEDGKPIQNTSTIIGWLEMVKLQEALRVLIPKNKI